MKLKVTMVLVLLISLGTVLFAEGQQEASSSAGYEDGLYFAQEDTFSAKTGWKYMVSLEVKDGTIVSAEWNGANKSAGVDKITASESGAYGMVAKGGAQAEWHEQAAKAEAFLLEEQDPTAISYTNAEGNTDAISGVSIHVKEFFTLAEEALARGPVGYGMWKDGSYHAEQESFSSTSGWKSTIDVTVISGYIVAVNWDAVHKDGGDTKKVQSADGRYGMVAKAGAQAEWHEQAMKMEAELLASQDPSMIDYNSDGYTDAVSGVSIHVNDFVELAAEALEGAKR